MSKTIVCALTAGVFLAGAASGVFLSPHVLAAAAALPGEPPTKTLIDNDKIQVNLVSFPKGFRREGGAPRPYDQLIVYLDPGDFKVIPRPGAAPPTNPAAAGLRTPESPIGLDGEVSKNPHQLGTSTWHPKGSMTPTLVTNAAYRALYIEIKK
jgi:hypothetical protein